MWMQLDPQIYRALIAYSHARTYFPFEMYCPRTGISILTALSLS